MISLFNQRQPGSTNVGAAGGFEHLSDTIMEFSVTKYSDGAWLCVVLDQQGSSTSIERKYGHGIEAQDAAESLLDAAYQLYAFCDSVPEALQRIYSSMNDDQKREALNLIGAETIQ